MRLSVFFLILVAVAQAHAQDSDYSGPSLEDAIKSIRDFNDQKVPEGVKNAETEGGEVAETPTPTPALDGGLISVPQIERFPTIQYPPPIKKAAEGKKGRKRFRYAMKNRWRMVKEQRAWAKKISDPPTRGEPELRVCSIDGNGVGTMKSYKKIFRKKGMKRHFRRRKALLKAIELAGCDVVALQGLVGGDITIAREGLQYFVKRLTKSTEVEWDGLVGASNAASYYNAFLLKKSIPLETFRSYAERSLLGFGEYKSPRFSRGPFELTLNVPGKEAAPTKKVLLYTMQLRRRAIGEKPEDEKHKMQMAETFRRIVERKTREFDDDEKPIVLFLGDRGGYRMAPTSQILEGQIELLDFRTKGACKVEWEISPKGLEEQKRREELEERLLAFAEENDKDFETLKEKNIPNEPLETRPKTKCEPVKKLKRYFGLLSENLPPKPKLLKRRVKGEVRLRLEEEDPKLVRERKLSNYERNSDIYLSQSDLTYALIDEGSPLRYAVGQLEVENDLENSPLIWVDLNW